MSQWNTRLSAETELTATANRFDGRYRAEPGCIMFLARQSYLARFYGRVVTATLDSQARLSLVALTWLIKDCYVTIAADLFLFMTEQDATAGRELAALWEAIPDSLPSTVLCASRPPIMRFHLQCGLETAHVHSCGW